MSKGTKWHISEDGVSRRCSAEPGNCPVGAEDQHFESRKDAERAYEKKMAHLEVAPSESKPRPPRDENAKYSVLSDVDGTLTKGSFVLDHAVKLHEDGVVDLGDTPARWKSDPKNEEIIAELGEKYRSAISGMTEDDIEVDGFVDDYLKDNSRFYSTFEQLQEFKRRGWEVQLISGSPDFLVKRLAERYGFHGTGSAYHKDESGRFTGHVDGMFGAQAKEDFVKQLDLKRFERILAFGDTSSDKPLFDVADHTTLVDPTEETSSKMRGDYTTRD